MQIKIRLYSCLAPGQTCLSRPISKIIPTMTKVCFCSICSNLKKKMTWTNFWLLFLKSEITTLKPSFRLFNIQILKILHRKMEDRKFSFKRLLTYVENEKRYFRNLIWNQNIFSRPSIFFVFVIVELLFLSKQFRGCYGKLRTRSGVEYLTTLLWEELKQLSFNMI